MSKKFLTPVGLLTKATNPASGFTGDTYYNTVDNKVYTYNGSAWVLTGVQGIQGTTGTVGLQGTTGLQGLTGTGIQGVQGPAGGGSGGGGTQGTQGTQGLQGFLGLQGLQGVAQLDIDGGAPDSIYGGLTAIDSGTP